MSYWRYNLLTRRSHLGPIGFWVGLAIGFFPFWALPIAILWRYLSS